MKRLAALFFALVMALPAAASGPANREIKEASDRGVLADLALAHALYAYAHEQADAIGMIAAARLLQSVDGLTSSMTAQVSILPGWAQAARLNTQRIPLIGVEAMMEGAQATGDDDATLDALRQVATDRPQGLTAERIDGVIEPGSQHSFTVTRFHQGALAETLAITGEGTDLDLAIADDQGNAICDDRGTGTASYCAFTPLREGSFTIVLTNAGFTALTYQLWVR